MTVLQTEHRALLAEGKGWFQAVHLLSERYNLDPSTIAATIRKADMMDKARG